MTLTQRLFGIVIAAIVLGSTTAQASDRSWLGADPGYGMRSWEDLYPGLDLTPEQRRQLADIRAETHRQVCAARDDLSVGPRERMNRIREARRNGQERELAVLTPEQREHLRQNPPTPSRLYTWQDRATRAQSSAGPRAAAPRNNAGLVPGVTDLTDEQTNRIAAIRAETQRQVQAVQRDRTLTQQQRSTRIQEIQRQGHQRVLNELTPAQRQQFDQAMSSRAGTPRGRETPSRGGHGMRRGGPGYTSHPGYVPGVDNLTDTQMNQIAAIRRNAQQQILAVNRNRSLTPQQRSARIREIQAEAHDRVMAVLTAEQRAAFENHWRQRSAIGRPT